MKEHSARRGAFGVCHSMCHAEHSGPTGQPGLGGQRGTPNWFSRDEAGVLPEGGEPGDCSCTGSAAYSPQAAPAGLSGREESKGPGRPAKLTESIESTKSTEPTESAGPKAPEAHVPAQFGQIRPAGQSGYAESPSAQDTPWEEYPERLALSLSDPSFSGICGPHDAVSRSIHQFAESLGNAIDAKDTHTRCHSEEVAVIAQALGQRLGLRRREVDILHIAGHLHDIGKIGVPDHVLYKQGPLTDKEWACVRMHPIIGANIVSPVRDFSDMTGIRAMILHHHERYDGTGYPYGLAGSAIPVGARIISVADALSAMLQNRPYRPPMVFSCALEEICAGSGTQFDPVVVEAFCAAQGTIEGLVAMLKAAEMPPCALSTDPGPRPAQGFSPKHS